MSRSLPRRALPLLPALALTLALTPAVGAGAAPTPSGPAGPSGGGAAVGDPSAARALDRALAVLAPPATARRTAQRPAPASATLALRDLRLALPALTGDDRAQARALLARPTDGASDPMGDGYTVPARRTCAKRVCVHWVRRTADAPPGRDWVDHTLRVVRGVWRHEVGTMDYRRPLPDRGRGGDDRLDVYLKDVGDVGLYGYCAPERARTGDRWRKPGYCVLDDDFARAQFGTRPRSALKVTAAHEFFHAVQFAYDYGEDRWLMEASATWIEERVADRVDDNRQYLPFGQVGRPRASLDTWDPQGFDQYGNWAFLEWLSLRFGDDVVRRTWRHAMGADRNWSVRAVRQALPEGASFVEAFRAWSAANTHPATSYPEGRDWPRPRFHATHRLRPGTPVTGEVRLDHLAAAHVLLRPSDDLAGHAWRLRVRVDGPARRTRPAATLLVTRPSGRVVPHPVVLGDGGRGVVEVRFGAATARRATLTLVNASTRYACWQGSLTWACQGDPRDEDRPFRWSARAIRG